MPLAKYNHMVKAIPPDRSDQRSLIDLTKWMATCGVAFRCR